MPFRPTRRLAIVLASLLTAVWAPAWGTAIGPPPFDHFEVTIPESIQAGETFPVAVSFLDRNGNEMPAGWRPESAMTLSFSPPATLVTPSALTRDNYAPDFRFRVRSDSPGKVEMKLLDGGGREIRSYTFFVKAPTPQPSASDLTAPPQARTADSLRAGWLDGVDVTETGNLALITFDTNGLADYTVSTSAKLSRKWIDVHFPKLKPDLSKRLKGGESVVGEVNADTADGGVTVSVEILPVRIGYDFYQEGPTLVLKVQRQ